MAKFDPTITPGSFPSLSDREKLERLVYYASLAPSSHNTQPWLFQVSGRTIEIYANWQRRLEKSDPENREMYISIGAAIENVHLAAQGLGLKYKYKINAEAEPVAVFDFFDLASSGVDEEAVNNICMRHCNRSDFDDKSLPEDFFDRIRKIADKSQVDINVVTEEGQKAKIAETVAQAIEAAFLDKGFTQELSHWLKPSLKKYRDGMPGYNIGVPYPVSFLMPWMLRHVNMSKQQRKMNEGPLKHSAAYVILSTEENSKSSWLRTGQAFESMAVEAQKHRIELGVLAAAIEIGDHYKHLQNILGITGRPQMFFRLGYCSDTPQGCPRLPLEMVIKNS